MRCCVTGTNHQGIVLQERDRTLLRDLATMRVIDREQAQLIAGFHSVTRANARLLALTRAHLLNRFYVGTFNGGKKSLYSLSQKGADLAQVPNTGLKRRADSILVGDVRTWVPARHPTSYLAQLPGAPLNSEPYHPGRIPGDPVTCKGSLHVCRSRPWD